MLASERFAHVLYIIGCRSGINDSASMFAVQVGLFNDLLMNDQRSLELVYCV